MSEYKIKIQRSDWDGDVQDDYLSLTQSLFVNGVEHFVEAWAADMPATSRGWEHVHNIQALFGDPLEGEAWRTNEIDGRAYFILVRPALGG